MMRGRASSAWGRFAPVAACAALCFSLANCANNNHIDPRYGVEPSARIVEPGVSVPKGGGVYRVGSPYIVAGRVYVPQDNPHYRADGVASWYGSEFYVTSPGKRRNFRCRSYYCSASDAAAAELCAGYEFEQWPFANRARQ